MLSLNTSCPIQSAALYLANPLPQVSDSTQTAITQVVLNARVDPHKKADLQALLLNWPNVCTDSLGNTRTIRHHISNEIPIWKKA